MSKKYGEIARINGLIFEQKIYEKIKNDEQFLKIIKSVNNMENEIIENEIIENEIIENHILVSNKKVNGICNKLTISKADIILTTKSNKYIPISIKMTNKGTQFQITTLDNMIAYLEYNNIIFPAKIKLIFQKFLGIVKPTEGELIELDKNRKVKNIQRYWLNEFSANDQEYFISFIKEIKELLLRFCICDGMCLDSKNKASIFILNNGSYTNTKIINPIVLNYKMLMEKIDIGDPKITKNGNLELNKYIGIQRKGSGKTEAQRQGLQFKDRGYKYIENMEENNLINLFNNKLIIESSTDSTDLINSTDVDIINNATNLVDNLVNDGVDNLPNDRVGDLAAVDLTADNLAAIEQPKLLGVSLFACSGIAEYYLSETNVEIILANELLKERCTVYNQVYPTVNVIQGDIYEKKDEIIEECIKNNIEFCIATPPCQSFSNAGRKQIDDKRTNLFLVLIDIIKSAKFKYVLIENVPSFMTSKYSTAAATIQDKFIEELGNIYNINTKILNTKDYGVPQSRKRSITLLHLKECKPWIHPEKYTTVPITVRNIIGDLPSLYNTNGATNEAANEAENEAVNEATNEATNEAANLIIKKWHTLKKHNDNHILWMSNTPTGQTAFNNKVHFPSINGRKIKGYNTTYKRIEWDQPAPTITMSSGSISSQNNVHPGNPYIKNGETLYDNPRVLSVYEIALLTGLDERWLSLVNTSEKIMRDIIGEAVPPKLIYHLCKDL